MNTPASAVVPSREAVEWLFDIHPIHITPQQIDELQEKSRTLLAEVERLTAREPLILELNRCVSENTAVLAASLDTNDLLIAERDTLRNIVAQLERTVAEVGQRYADVTHDLTCIGDLVLHGVVRLPEGEYAKKVHGTVADQAAALAERDKDAERLDWLQAHPRLSEMHIDGKVVNCYVYAVAGHSKWTLREIIDAALAASVSTQEEK